MRCTCKPNKKKAAKLNILLGVLCPLYYNGFPILFGNCEINCQNFMILILHILDFENRKLTKFQSKWFINFRVIILINFNIQILKLSFYIRF